MRDTTPVQHQRESLQKAESEVIESVHYQLTATQDHMEPNAEIAYHAIVEGYSNFKKTHNAAEVNKFVTDLSKTFKDNGWLPEIAVAFGYEHLSKQSVFSRLTPDQLDKLAKDHDPLKAALGKELRQDVETIKGRNPETKMQGGNFLGWGKTEVPGLGRDDLNKYLDLNEPVRRAREEAETLQGGLFDRVYKSAHPGKTAGDGDVLTQDDFIQYVNKNIKKLSVSEVNETRQIIENWHNDSLRTLSARERETLLSKKSIREAITRMNRDNPPSNTD